MFGRLAAGFTGGSFVGAGPGAGVGAGAGLVPPAVTTPVTAVDGSLRSPAVL